MSRTYWLGLIFLIWVLKGINSILQKRDLNFYFKKSSLLPMYFIQVLDFILTLNIISFFCKSLLIPIEACSKKIKSSSLH